MEYGSEFGVPRTDLISDRVSGSYRDASQACSMKAQHRFKYGRSWICGRARELSKRVVAIHDNNSVALRDTHNKASDVTLALKVDLIGSY